MFVSKIAMKKIGHRACLSDRMAQSYPHFPPVMPVQPRTYNLHDFLVCPLCVFVCTAYLIIFVYHSCTCISIRNRVIKTLSLQW